MTDQKSVIEWYNEEAPTYDRSRLRLAINRKRHSVECDLLSNQFQHGRILEIGSGTGRYALNLQNHGVNIIGLDISKNMLLRAKGLSRIRASSYNLPFRENSFNGVYLIRAFKFMEPQKTLKEINRVLCSRGVIFLLMASIECAYCRLMEMAKRYNRILHNRRFLHLLFKFLGTPYFLSFKESGSKLHAQTYSKSWFKEAFSRLGFSKPQFSEIFVYYRLVVSARKTINEAVK